MFDFSMVAILFEHTVFTKPTCMLVQFLHEPLNVSI